MSPVQVQLLLAAIWFWPAVCAHRDLKHRGQPALGRITAAALVVFFPLGVTFWLGSRAGRRPLRQDDSNAR